MIDDRELRHQFLLEGRELVDAAAAALLAIDRTGPDAARTADAFRAVHTLKGAAAICGLAPLERILHAAEDLLEGLRAGRLAPEATTGPLLDAVSLSEAWLGVIETSGTLPPDAEAAAARTETRLRATTGAASTPIAEPRSQALPPETLAALALRHAPAIARAGTATLTAFRYTPDRDCFFRGDDPLALVGRVPGLVALELALAESATAADPFDPFRCHLVIEALSTADAATLRPIFRLCADQVAFGAIAPPPSRAEAARPTLRVAVDRVDRLVALAGELVAGRNALAERVASVAARDAALGRALRADLAGVERLAAGLHRAATELRLTPLARIFRRLPLAVRETASSLGKRVRLATAGDEVEADASVVDALFEPLLHLLRNAVDHGIEDAATRRAAGKPETGQITLAARADAHGLAVTITDDGGGMDPAALRSSAAARGLADAATLAALTDAQALELVFTPGFSTAAAVTGVSGRGVGMDAVRRSVEALGGRVTLTSSAGSGTTVRLTLPQSASLTPAMIVRASGCRFGVPIDAVAEAARVAIATILPLGDAEAFILRDRTVPLRSLAALLGLDTAPRPGAHATVLLLRATAGGGDPVAVEVDAVLGRADLLLRPLEGLLAGMPGMLGTAVEADGSALLVLDLPALASWQ